MQSIEAALDAVRQQFETSRTEAVQQGRREATAELNQFTRRLRQYESEQAFTRAVVDGASLFTSGAAFYAVEGASCVLRAQAGLELPAGHTFPCASARAISQAIESKETVVALRSAAEVGEALASPERTQRGFAVPIENAERVSGMLFATGDADVPGLELVASLASLVLSRKQTQSGLSELKPAAAAPVNSGQVYPAPVSGLPPWAALNEEQRSLHSRAQRFARVKVSEWLLHKPEIFGAGLEQNDIYLFLKKEIDAARESYRTQFLSERSMVDYLHLELLAVAAEGKAPAAVEEHERKLGAEYPGPLV